MLKLNDIKRTAREVGFDLCGVAQCRDLESDRAFLEGWLERGFGGSLDYLKKNIAVRADATSLVEGAKTVIVCALAYKNEISNGYSCNARGKVASYALTTDYHRTIKDMLFELCRRLKAHDEKFAARCFVDSAPIFEKRYAVEAGLGWIGRQSLLITPDYGSFVLLGEVVTSAECDLYDTPLESVGCGECRRCIEACPNGAIQERHIDTTRCISCATIERRGEGEQCPLHGWIFGCDECQSVCPYNRKAPCATSPQVIPIFNPKEMSLEEWLSMTEEEFRSRFGSTPLARAGLERLKENAGGN